MSTTRSWLLVVLTATAAVTFTTPTTAQFGGPGLQWLDSAGTAVGALRPGCAVHNTATAVGQTVTIRMWGDLNSPFALLVAPGTIPCLPLPGIGSGLLLMFPIAPVVDLVVTTPTPCLSCPEAFVDLRIQIPPGLPPGTPVSFQGVGFGFRQVSFTDAITVTVR